jgi:hypothetical protein
MRTEITTVIRYSLRSMREAWFRLTDEVRPGPTAGTEQWFPLGMEELSELMQAA